MRVNKIEGKQAKIKPNMYTTVSHGIDLKKKQNKPLRQKQTTKSG